MKGTMPAGNQPHVYEPIRQRISQMRWRPYEDEMFIDTEELDYQEADELYY